MQQNPILKTFACLGTTLLLLCTSIVVSATQESGLKGSECVVVLHGMGRTAYSMDEIEKVLRGAGYRVWNKAYPSLSETIETLSQQTIDEALQYCREHSDSSIHFVTHSLGGILLRHYLQTNNIDGLGKVLMLSPPNHGSEIVDKYKDNWLFRTVMGPAFLQLGTDGIVQTLQPIAGTIGIITGNVSSDPWFSDAIPGPDDGKVSVESAKLAEMQDFLIVPAGHTFIMDDAMVVQQVQHFLREGRFQRAEHSENRSGHNSSQ
jgi:hypothetical protein